MKLFTITLLSALTVPGHAESLLSGLQEWQKTIKKKEVVSTTNSPSTVKMEPITKTRSSGLCSEPEQTSIPLAYITSMIADVDNKLTLQHDSRSGKLTVSSPEMISNCSSMVDWVSSARDVDGVRKYSIEAKVKKGTDCVGNVCSYEVAKVENEKFIGFEKVKVKANLDGFVECLDKSGATKNGKVVPGAIYPAALSETFEGFKESGDVLFVSHGPQSKLIKAKYDKFVEVDACDHYEKITSDGVAIKSLADEENEVIAAEAAKVRNCGEYEKIAEFIEKYSQYSSDMNQIRDELLLDAVKKATKAIAEGKYTEEDLKTLADFEKYIVMDRIKLLNTAYNQAQQLEGSDRAAMLETAKKLSAELLTYNNAPYVTAAIVAKLEADGRFPEAEQANGMKALVVTHAKMGQKIDNVVVTPSVAAQQTAQHRQAYAKQIEVKRERYEIRTGQTTGQAKLYFDLASRMRRNIDVRTQNYGQEMAEEYARTTQPQGYCFRSPFRNVPRCIQKSQERLAELQAQLVHFNKVDAERAAEYEARATEYAKLEKEGSAYVAQQNGEAPPAATEDTTRPVARADDEATAIAAINPQTWVNPYTNQQQMQGGTTPYQPNNVFTGQDQQGIPPQGYNPYAQQQPQQQGINPYPQQQSFMGQQNYGAQFGMNAQFGANQQSYYPQGQNPGYAYNYNSGQQFSGYPQQQFQQQQFGQQQFGQQPMQQGQWGNQNQFSSRNNMYGQ